METLGLTEAQVQIGSYRVRLDGCIRERVRGREQQDRQWRLNLRTQSVFERITRNSRSALQRGIGAPETAAEVNDRRKAVEAERTQYENLRKTSERPSRRLIKLSGTPGIEERKETALRVRERMKEAREACAHFDTHFHRSNCVRAKLRELGARER